MSKTAYLDARPVLAWKDKVPEVPHNWPALEEALFEWEQCYEARQNTLTGKILCLKATQLWNQLLCYQSKLVSKFSNGWLDGFKHRHNIQQRNQHGEAVSADRAKHSAEMKAKIGEVSAFCNPDNSFNMDETGSSGR